MQCDVLTMFYTILISSLVGTLLAAYVLNVNVLLLDFTVFYMTAIHFKVCPCMECLKLMYGFA